MQRGCRRLFLNLYLFNQGLQSIHTFFSWHGRASHSCSFTASHLDAVHRNLGPLYRATEQLRWSDWSFYKDAALVLFQQWEKISIQLCLLNLIKLLRLGSLTSKQHFNTTMTKQKKKHILRGWLNLKFRLNPPENPVKHWKAKEKPPEVPIYLYLIIIII